MIAYTYATTLKQLHSCFRSNESPSNLYGRTVHSPNQAFLSALSHAYTHETIVSLREEFTLFLSTHKNKVNSDYFTACSVLWDLMEASITGCFFRRAPHSDRSHSSTLTGSSSGFPQGFHCTYLASTHPLLPDSKWYSLFLSVTLLFPHHSLSLAPFSLVHPSLFLFQSLWVSLSRSRSPSLSLSLSLSLSISLSLSRSLSLPLSLPQPCIKRPWCLPHRALSVLCSALITLQNKPCQSLQWCVGVSHFYISDSWQSFAPKHKFLEQILCRGARIQRCVCVCSARICLVKSLFICIPRM